MPSTEKKSRAVRFCVSAVLAVSRRKLGQSENSGSSGGPRGFRAKASKVGPRVSFESLLEVVPDERR